MSRCTACNRILTDQELKLSFDYCRRCSQLIVDDLRTYKPTADLIDHKKVKRKFNITTPEDILAAYKNFK